MKGQHIDPVSYIREIDTYADLSPDEAVARNLHILERCPECQARILAHLQLASFDDFLALISRSRDPLHRHVKRGDAGRADYRSPRRAGQ